MPCLIVLDLMMPRMNGFEFLHRQIRRLPIFLHRIHVDFVVQMPPMGDDFIFARIGNYTFSHKRQVIDVLRFIRFVALPP